MIHAVEQPKPKYEFEFLQVAIAPKPVANITGLKAFRSFTPEALTYELHIAVACREDGELVHIIPLPVEEVPAMELQGWIENNLENVLLARAAEYEAGIQLEGAE